MKAFFGKGIYAKYGFAKRYAMFLLVLLVMASVFGAFKKDNGSLIHGLVRVEFVKKIWDEAPHNAFTDLTYYKGYWYCVFREAESHFTEDGPGKIRLIRSADTEIWTSVKMFSDEDYDLRDPKLTVSDKNRLMINFCAIPLTDSLKGRAAETRMVKSKNGTKWSAPENLNLQNQIAWRVTWHQNTAYTITYQPNGNVYLYKSRNGADYKLISKLPIKGQPTESSVTFMPDGKMLALIREDEKPDRYYLGESNPPYTSWQFNEVEKFAGGPNMIKLPDNNVLATFRRYESGAGKLCLAKVEDNKLKEITDVKSGGDCGYAGMVWKDDALYLSYYSTHEQKTSIYLAKIKFQRRN